jgi:hypothetical protein
VSPAFHQNIEISSENWDQNSLLCTMWCTRG